MYGCLSLRCGRMKHLAFLKRYALLMSAKDRNAVRAASTGFPAVQAVRQTPCCVVMQPCLYVSHHPPFVCAAAVELAVLCRQSKALLQSKRIAARISSKEWTIGRTKVCVSSALCAAVRHLMVKRPSHRSSFVLAWRVCWT